MNCFPLIHQVERDYKVIRVFQNKKEAEKSRDTLIERLSDEDRKNQHYHIEEAYFVKEDKNDATF